jgi:hypothetical protein
MNKRCRKVALLLRKLAGELHQHAMAEFAVVLTMLIVLTIVVVSAMSLYAPKTAAKPNAPKSTAKPDAPKTTTPRNAPKSTTKPGAPKTPAQRDAPKTTARRDDPKTPAPREAAKPAAKPDFVLTEEFKEILHVLNDTTDSIFISGKAGTGKSQLLQYFTERTPKQFVVLAPTGIAALNVKGQTIHSFFRFAGGIIQPNALGADRARSSLFENLEMVIIDEVSMVRADLMDGIDWALRVNRNNRGTPFGGVQMVFIGDLYQLPPVVAGNEVSRFIQTQYGGEYFFNAPVFSGGFHYVRIQLTHVFRQQDDAFRQVLSRIRENQAGPPDFALLNARHEAQAGDAVADAVYLTTTNQHVRKINKSNLEKLPTPEVVYRASFTGKMEEEYRGLYAKLQAKEITEAQFEEQLEGKLPADVHLKLKLGAQVMFIKNDSQKRWVNGTVGRLVEMNDDHLWVRVEGKTHPVEREQWGEIAYAYDARTKEIKEQTKGTFRQFPVKLAWAMTIHKSQGKTFDQAVIDLGSGAFAHGQTYVALSRCRTLPGIRLKQRIGPRDVIVDKRVAEYYRTAFGNGTRN